jgi:hypothetical protein
VLLVGPSPHIATACFGRSFNHNYVGKNASTNGKDVAEEVSLSLSITPHSVGLLWTSYAPQRPLPDNTQHLQGTDIELAIPAGYRPQTHALDRAATGTVPN